jgi:PASTA domain
VMRGSRVLATVAVAVPVVVPNVVGVTRQRAVALLNAAGLRADAAPDAAATSRLVERQQPAANTRVARLSTVALFVAAPPQLPPTQQPEPLAPVPAPVPGPVPGPTPTPALVPGLVPGPAPTPVPAVQVAPSAAVPVQPLLPPWLLTLLVALAAIGVSTFRLWWPGSSPPPPPIQAATPATPPPALAVRPERGDTSLRLEVTGRSLISMDVRIRVERGAAEQTLDVQGDALVVEERRLYE